MLWLGSRRGEGRALWRRLLVRVLIELIRVRLKNEFHLASGGGHRAQVEIERSGQIETIVVAAGVKEARLELGGHAALVDEAQSETTSLGERRQRVGGDEQLAQHHAHRVFALALSRSSRVVVVLADVVVADVVVVVVRHDDAVGVHGELAGEIGKGKAIALEHSVVDAVLVLTVTVAVSVTVVSVCVAVSGVWRSEDEQFGAGEDVGAQRRQNALLQQERKARRLAAAVRAQRAHRHPANLSLLERALREHSSQIHHARHRRRCTKRRLFFFFFLLVMTGKNNNTQ